MTHLSRAFESKEASRQEIRQPAMHAQELEDQTLTYSTFRGHAGALFVLESKGTWAHAGYHLSSATAGPPLLSLPFAVAGLGWAPGIFALCMGALVSFYACYSLSLVMENMEQKGNRSLRYRDLAQHVVGASKNSPPKDYSIIGTPIHKMFTVFDSISIMISAYANPLIVEIQATLAPPINGKMVKGLAICYTVALSTFFSVAASGYWAFGNSCDGIIFDNMFSSGVVVLVPNWLYVMGNALACVQLVVITVLYLQPTFEKLEEMVADVNQGRFSKRNFLPRLLGRSLFVIAATLLAAMLPFFAEFSAFVGSLGFTPICIILPLLFYNLVFKPNSRTLAFWANYSIMAAASVVVLLGTIASLRQIVVDAKTYRLFANL